MGISGNLKGYEMSQRFNGISMAYNGIYNWHIVAICVSGNGRSTAPKVGYVISLEKIEQNHGYGMMSWVATAGSGRVSLYTTPSNRKARLAVDGSWIGDSMGSGNSNHFWEF
jgi:hypothetical protein